MDLTIVCNFRATASSRRCSSPCARRSYFKVDGPAYRLPRREILDMVRAAAVRVAEIVANERFTRPDRHPKASDRISRDFLKCLRQVIREVGYNRWR